MKRWYENPAWGMVGAGVLVLEEGRVIADGTPEALLRESLTPVCNLNAVLSMC